MNKKVIITGASSGIGYHMAIELAKRNYDLVIVARRKEKLEELKIKIGTINNNIKVEVEVLDLSDMSNCKKLEKKYFNNLDMFINNAGFGLLGSLVSQNEDKVAQMIDLNIKALTFFSQQFLKEQNVSKNKILINIGSTAGYPKLFPNNNVYATSKKYVNSFTNSLRYEVKKSGTKDRVVLVMPGYIETEWLENAKQGVKRINGTPAGKFAKITINKILSKNKNLVIYGKYSKTIRISKYLPSCIITPIMAKVMSKL